MNRNTFFWITFVILIAIIVSAAVYLSYSRAPQSLPASSIVTNIDFTKLPDRFPLEIPFFDQMMVAENFTVDRGATFETTREYVSTLSTWEAFADYQKYFLSNGWQLLSMTTVSSEKIVSGRKGDVQLSFSVKPGPYHPTSTSEIKLSFTYLK